MYVQRAYTATQRQRYENTNEQQQQPSSQAWQQKQKQVKAKTCCRYSLPHAATKFWFDDVMMLYLIFLVLSVLYLSNLFIFLILHYFVHCFCAAFDKQTFCLFHFGKLYMKTNSGESKNTRSNTHVCAYNANNTVIAKQANDYLPTWPVHLELPKI